MTFEAYSYKTYLALSIDRKAVSVKNSELINVALNLNKKNMPVSKNKSILINKN